MNKRVAHFVRKCLPSSASFIRNQIMSHIRYIPFIVYKEPIDSQLAQDIKAKYDNLFLDKEKNGFELTFSDFLYSSLKRITKRDVQKILKFLDDKKVRILHFHYGTDAGMYLDAIKSSPVPALVSFYGYDCSSFPRICFGYGKYYLSQVFRHIDYVLAMSDDMRNDLLQIGCPEDKIIVHYYGTDVRNFSYDRKYEDKNRMTLLITSSLDEKKGHWSILNALQRLEPSIKSRICLRIVGSGPLDEELKRFVNQNGLRDIVTFIGSLKYLSREFLQEFYDADIFIHPSVVASNGDKEGIPGAVVEAMATGLPVISTYHAGIPYVIRHGDTGLLAEEKDTEAIAEYISRLVVNRNLRKDIGQRAQEYAMKNLDLKQKQIELENIYDFVIDNHSKRK